MDKFKMMEMLFNKEDINKVDIAIPEPWAEKARNVGVNTDYYVWSYIKNITFGEPVNLAELFFKKCQIDFHGKIEVIK